jgi:ketosteroid isomerase-like protein
MTSNQDGCGRPQRSRIDIRHLRLLLLAAVATAALSACGSPEWETAAPTPGSTPTSTATQTGPATPSPDEAAILAANANQTRWMIDADVERLGELLDENFTAIHITGYEQSKAEWLDQIRSGQMTYHDVAEQSVSVDIDGDTAILVKRNLVTATINGTRGTWPLESTTTYAKTDGVWRPTSSRAITY